jgi:hypothetical protein
MLAAAVIALGSYVLYDRYSRDYAVSTEEDGGAVTRVVASTFSRASALKVATFAGTVQSVARDSRGLGWLNSERVSKMPFSVDYFIDVSAVTPADISWNAGDGALTVNVPDISVARPNIDEARRTMVQTRGMFVTRGAAEELARRSSISAQRDVAADAMKPERLALARENARRALRNLLGAPLAAAGMPVRSFTLRFPAERRDDEQWDLSRSPKDVLAKPR